MDDTEVITQALASLINTELVAKQLEQAFKDVSMIVDKSRVNHLFSFISD